MASLKNRFMHQSRNLMKYVVLNNLDEKIWQEVVDKSPVATFYHTPEWTKIICETFPKWENATFGLEFEDGNRAVFPILRRPLIGKVPFYWHESIVPGAYGGPIFIKPPKSEHYEALTNELLKFRNILIVNNPYLGWFTDENFEKRTSFTQIIPLKQDFSEVWENISKGRRDAIRYAKKNGVTYKEVDFSEYYKTYFEIYTDQLGRWGKYATGYYPIKLFYNLAQHARTNPEVKLWTAWLDGKMISGVVVLYHQRHLALWHGATLTKYFKFRPVDLLYSAVMEAACKEGYEYFDFGSSGGHEGVVQFKEHYGAIKLSFVVYRRRNIMGMMYRAVRFFRNYLGKCPED